VASHHSAKSQGAGLKLCHLGSKFQKFCKSPSSSPFSDVYNTEAEAVGSFSKGANA